MSPINNHPNIRFTDPITYQDNQNFFFKIAAAADSYLNCFNTNKYVISSPLNQKGVHTAFLEKNTDRSSRKLYTRTKIATYILIIPPTAALICTIAARLWLGTVPIVYEDEEAILAENRLLLEPHKLEEEAILKYSVKELIEKYSNADRKENKFEFRSEKFQIGSFTENFKTYMKKFLPKPDQNGTEDFQIDSFIENLKAYVKKFSPEPNPNRTKEDSFGFINKLDLQPGSKIFICADLHGDLKTLIDTLKLLQKEQFLDEHYRCIKGRHLLFLGDYCDRGEHGVRILELLIFLRNENPDQIHLIRGNHEDISINQDFAGRDRLLQEIVSHNNLDRRKALDAFYETMPLTTYISIQNETGKREYIQCTHGLFEPTMDPTPLLEPSSNKDYIYVPKKRAFSERITKIEEGNPLYESAKQIKNIWEEHKQYENREITLYNWGDISESETSNYGPAGNRKFKLNQKDISAYLDICQGENHTVKMIFRGHQHTFNHTKSGEKIIATTLPVGMNSPYKSAYSNQINRTYILDLEKEIENCKKWALCINPENGNSWITKPVLLDKEEDDRLEGVYKTY